MPDYHLPPAIWHSWLADDGSLIVRPTPKSRYFVRVMPWPDFQIYDYYGGVNENNYRDLRWSKCDELPVPLISAEVVTGRKDTKSFIDAIPKEIRDIVAPYYYAQYEMLQILREHQSAVDLVKHDPHIVWILASAHLKRKYDSEEVNTILKMKRHELLSRLTGVGIQKRAVNLLRKVKLNHETSYDGLKTIVSTIMHGDRVDYFYRYWDEVTPEAIRSVLSKKSNAYSKMLADAVSECLLSDWGKEIDSVQQLWDTLKRVSARNPQIVRDEEIESCSNYQQLKNLHRRWLLERDQRTWQQRLRQLQELRLRDEQLVARRAEQLNPDWLDQEYADLSPEIQDDENVVRLRTPRMMKDEGRKMRHCIFIYAEQAMDGRNTYYRIKTPFGERLSMELKRISDSHYQIQQVFRAENRHPSKKAILFIQQWLRQRLPENVYLSTVC